MNELVNIVTVGGGTGSYTVLFELKNAPGVSLRALVSMADSGGSTGVLRDELGVLPAGDVRQCLVALSSESGTLRNLMNYRFSEGGLAGHNFGNIFLAALEKVTGDFRLGVEIASEILKVKGKVIPVTENRAELAIKLQSGEVLKGEDNIDKADLQSRDIAEVFFTTTVMLNDKARSAILDAKYIVIGPGNFYCSLLPNLIVSGFKEAIRDTEARIIVPINLTNKQGHTMHWRASDYVKNIEAYLEKSVDVILLNTEPPSPEQVKRYQLEEGDGVLVEDDLSGDPRVIRENLLSPLFFAKDKTDSIERSFIRHDSKKLADCIRRITNRK